MKELEKSDNDDCVQFCRFQLLRERASFVVTGDKIFGFGMS